MALKKLWLCKKYNTCSYKKKKIIADEELY